MVPSKEHPSDPTDLVTAFNEVVPEANLRVDRYNPNLNNPARNVHVGVDSSSPTADDAGYSVPPRIGYGFPEFIPCNQYDIIINNGNLENLTQKDMMLETTSSSLTADGSAASPNIHAYGDPGSGDGHVPSLDYSSDDQNFSSAVSSSASDWWKSADIGVTYKNLEVFDNNLTDEQVSDFIINKLT